VEITRNNRNTVTIFIRKLYINIDINKQKTFLLKYNNIESVIKLIYFCLYVLLKFIMTQGHLIPKN